MLQFTNYKQVTFNDIIGNNANFTDDQNEQLNIALDKIKGVLPPPDTAKSTFILYGNDGNYYLTFRM